MRNFAILRIRDAKMARWRSPGFYMLGGSERAAAACAACAAAASVIIMYITPAGRASDDVLLHEHDPF